MTRAKTIEKLLNTSINCRVSEEELYRMDALLEEMIDKTEDEVLLEKLNEKLKDVDSAIRIIRHLNDE